MLTFISRVLFERNLNLFDLTILVVLFTFLPWWVAMPGYLAFSWTLSFKLSNYFLQQKSK